MTTVLSPDFHGTGEELPPPAFGCVQSSLPVAASKLAQAFRHDASGWLLEHCGHPTANWPWAPQEPKTAPTLAGWGPLLAIGFIVGSFAAFFGVGGGVIAVPLIMVFLHQSMHRAVGNSSGLMVVSALTAALSYVWHGWGNPQLPPFSAGYVNLLVTLLVAPFTVLMARVGVRIANRTSHARLVRVFAVLIILVGLRMALSVFVWP